MNKFFLSALLLLGAACTAPASPVLGIFDLSGYVDTGLPPQSHSVVPLGQHFVLLFQAYGSQFGSGPTDLDAFNFDLTYDPNVIAPTSIQEEGYFAQNGLGLFYQLTQGKISNIGDIVAGPGPGENLLYSLPLATADTLLEINFVAVGAGSTNIVIPYNGDLYYADSNGNISTPLVGMESVTVYPLLGSGAPPPAVPEPQSAGILAVGGFVLMGLGLVRKQAAWRSR